MVPGEQHLRHLPAPESFRPGVLGTFQQPRLEGVRPGRFLVPQHPRNQPHQGVDQRQSRQRPVAQDIIPHGNLLIDPPLPHALVDPLVMTAHQKQAGVARHQLPDVRLD